MSLYSSTFNCMPLDASNRRAISIFAVIVLYRVRPQQSSSLQTLLDAIRCLDDPYLRVTLLLADNTPGGQSTGELDPTVRYESFPDNPGLVTPYRIALARAETEGYEWLLTLDQDTHLPPDFLSIFARLARQYTDDKRVAAIVPRICDNQRVVSPFRFVGGFMPRLIGSGISGILGAHASALNSASLLRISALHRAGGYDDKFPLNNSDTALFHRLDKAGFQIVLADEVIVQHELAIMSRGERMTLGRYQQLLIDERNFWDLHMSPLARSERLIRLAGRWAKGFLEKEDAAFRRVTFNELKKRLFSSRATRIREQSRLAASLRLPKL